MLPQSNFFKLKFECGKKLWLFACFSIVVRKVCHQKGMLITKDDDSTRYVAVQIDF